MNESLIAFRSELTEKLLDFIWRQWSQLGASGSSRDFPENWIVDPEALLAFSSDIGRLDARIFDEILDWLKLNGHWINTQRLSKIVFHDQIGDPAVIGAIAAWMKKNDKDIKWHGIAVKNHPWIKNPPESLFISQKHTVIPDVDQDPRFITYGLIRPRVEPRGLSQPVDMRDTPNAVFTFRALFGIGLRADVVLYMMSPVSAHARLIAEDLGYNHMRVQEVMHDLASAGMLSVIETGRSKNYVMDRDRWWSAIMGNAPSPIWPNWRAFYRGVGILMHDIWTIDAERADDYIAFSIIRTALEKARNDLYAFDSRPVTLPRVDEMTWPSLTDMMRLLGASWGSWQA